MLERVAHRRPIGARWPCEPEWEQSSPTWRRRRPSTPNDPASVQRLADTARASEPAANRVIDYTFNKCGATIGEVTPVVTAPRLAPTTAANEPTAGGRRRAAGQMDLAAAQDDVVDQAVRLGLFGGEPAVALAVGLDLLERLAASAAR